MRRATPLFKSTLFFLLAAGLSLCVWSCSGPRAKGKAAEPDYSTTRLSEKSIFKAAFLSLSEPIPLGKIHSWRLHVEDANARALTDAVISIEGGMPAHGHGLPTKPRVTQNLGGGDYLVEGMKFQMHGLWVVRFGISAAGKTDTVTFNLQL